MISDRGWRTAAALAALLVLAGCASSKGGGDSGTGLTAADNVTNAPVAGGVNVTPGSEEDFMVGVGRRTFFKQSSAELDDTARATLDKQAQWLNQYPQWKVKLQGSADDPGSPQAQRALSQKRADAVRDYLAMQGIGHERMLAKGYGREKIGDDCPEIECKSQNRRVVTNLQDNPEF
ncbi:MAG: OmpA family protein [Parvibaculaceae bacterium]